MAKEDKVGIAAPIMQSFTSIGPFLDFVAVFSVIAISSGTMLPIVMLLSFFIGYSTMNTTYRLSRMYVSSGGYYTYIGIILGKAPGIFTALMYIFYSLLVLPNISLFFGSFFKATASAYIVFPRSAELVVSLLFSGSILAFVSRGLKLTLKYTVVAGILEMIMLSSVTALFFMHPAGSLQSAVAGQFSINAVWLGLIFGILAFSGGGSSIFISDSVKEPRKSIPGSLMLSYTTSGIIMVISSLSLVIFLGKTGISQYTVNPFIILSIVKSRFGAVFFIIFAAFSVSSAANLSISYLNALKNAFMRVLSENIFGDRMKESFSANHLLLLIFALSAAFEVVAYYNSSFFFTFAALAGAVGLTYIVVHIISNIALMKKWRELGFGQAILPAISIGLLSLTFYYSFFDPQYSFFTTNVIFGAIVLLSLAYLLSVLMRKALYRSISIQATQPSDGGAIGSGR